MIPLRTLIVSDIHGNLPALEAVLATPEAQSCGGIISLGDHVSFCAQSRQVHQRLLSLDARMLMGNHEERLTRPGDSAFDGYNWAPMRWTARQMAGIDLQLPLDLRIGSVLFTHGTPGDPYHLVYPEDLPQMLSDLPEGVTLLISGHNHRQWDVAHGGKRAFNPGSVGLTEEGRGGLAPFAILEDGVLTRHTAVYDPYDTIRAMISSGMCLAAPEICRAVAHELLTGEYQGVLKLMRHVSAFAASHGLDFGDRAAWQAADRTYGWEEPLTSPEYWTNLEESL